MRERGGGKLQLFLGLLVTAVIIVGALRVIPVYIRSYEFKDEMRTQAKFAGVERKTPEVIRAALLQKARELDLPVTAEKIRITPERGGVRIIASFTVPVDLVVYQTDISFNFDEDTGSAF